MDEEQTNRSTKLSYNISKNMGFAIGIGIVIFPLENKNIENEYYLYINLGKINIAIGMLFK